MKLIKKIGAGLLLTFGIPLTIYAIAEIVNPDTDSDDREDAIAALIIFTLPATAVGGWLAWSVYKQGKQEQAARDKEVNARLKSTFFRLVQEGEGRITVMRFAMETQLSGEEAKQFLDQKVKEFDGNFDVSEQGNVAYRFQL